MIRFSGLFSSRALGSVTVKLITSDEVLLVLLMKSVTTALMLILSITWSSSSRRLISVSRRDQRIMLMNIAALLHSFSVVNIVGIPSTSVVILMFNTNIRVSPEKSAGLTDKWRQRLNIKQCSDIFILNYPSWRQLFAGKILTELFHLPGSECNWMLQ